VAVPTIASHVARIRVRQQIRRGNRDCSRPKMGGKGASTSMRNRLRVPIFRKQDIFFLFFIIVKLILFCKLMLKMVYFSQFCKIGHVFQI
jgi:hypothetical protein